MLYLLAEPERLTLITTEPSRVLSASSKHLKCYAEKDAFKEEEHLFKMLLNSLWFEIRLVTNSQLLASILPKYYP